MPLSLRDLWDSITSRPSRKHLKLLLAGAEQRGARLSARVAELEETKATLTDGVQTLRERADEAQREHRALVDMIVAKDLVGLVYS
ncbi:hypothetical protein ACFCZ3_19810 [Cellulosimicrobium cellulans]|uniref:hypothetical protein n=1 Tax=Cellulosimicrobium cellulans TaxID=1710 RepID=UPI0035D7D4B2